MRNIRIASMLIPVLLFLSCAALFRLTKEDVVELSQAEVSDDVILRQIEASGTTFDLSSDDILKLKEAGVSDRTIQAMLQTKIEQRKAWEERDRWEPLTFPSRGYAYPHRLGGASGVCRWAYVDSVLTREDIVKMAQSGVGDDVIVRQIEAKGRFDLTADEIVQLKEAEVSDPVIEATVESGEQKSTEPVYQIHYTPYPFQFYWRDYDWYWRPYLWRGRYRPYYRHDLSIAHPSHKYYRYRARRFRD